MTHRAKPRIYFLSWFEDLMLKHLLRKFVKRRSMDLLFGELYKANKYVFFEDNHFDHEHNILEAFHKEMEYQLYAQSQEKNS